MVRVKGKHYFIGRYRFLLFVMLLSMSAIIIKSVHLHIFKGDFLRDAGKKRYLRHESLLANRGKIMDRHAQPLAVSAPVVSVIVNPSLIYSSDSHEEEFESRVTQLAEMLGVDASYILDRVQRFREKGFVYLARQLPPHQVALLDEEPIIGVSVSKEFKRFYPAADVTAHLVGFTNIDDRGQEGFELAYDEYLRGVPGKKRVIKTRKGQIVEDLGVVQAPESGQDLHLSIDLRMQYWASKVLREAVKARRAESGSLVAMDVATGEVLALVNEPSYNPNDRKNLKVAALRNRAMTDAVEPGSTIKPFAVAAALQAGIVRPETAVETHPGYMPVGRKLIKDFRNYGTLDVTGVLTKSSNVGSVKLVLALSQPELYVNLLHDVGFGTESGSGFPGETIGIMPLRSKWRSLELATLSYGYGLSVNLLQLVRAYSVIANDGVLNPASLMKVNGPPQGIRVMDQQTSRQVAKMLETVTGSEGTAKRARVPGYRVAGKTGTVFRVGSAGYEEDQYRSLFVGFAPAAKPEIVLGVIVEDPKGDEHKGGEVAAPIFAQAMDGLLRIKSVLPDAIDEMDQSVAVR